MKKWEYLYVIAESMKVTHVNSVCIGQTTESYAFSTEEAKKKTRIGPTAYDFLNEMGREGWEVISATRLTSMEFIIMKRQLE